MTRYVNQPLSYLSTDTFAVDIETTGLDPYLYKLLSIAVSDGTDVWIWTHDYGFEDVLPLLSSSEITKIIHNAVFEYKWFLHNFNLELENFYDTLLAEKVVAESDNLPMSLDELIGRYIGLYTTKETRKTFENHPGFDVEPVTEEQLEYMEIDVLYLHEIKKHQLKEISLKRLGRTVNLEFSVVPAVSSLEYNGITLDTDMWQDIVGTMEVMLYELEIQMRELIGKDYVLEVPAKKKGEDIIKEIPAKEINLGSPNQLKALLNTRFRTKIGSTAAGVLEGLENEDGELGVFANLLLSHRKWSKRLGFDYIKFVHPITGKVHPSYHQLGTRTGRFSCSNPNLQQVPRPEKTGPNLRHVWVADNEDFVIIRADYEQQEPRIFAQLSKDAAMVAACNKEDVYIEFGKHIFGKTIEKGSEERYDSKQFVLATGYGAGAEKLSKTSGKPVEHCQAIKQIIQEKFPTMASYGQKMFRQAKQYHYVETAIGRRRYFDNPIYTESVNTPVQGTAADMFKLALVKVHQALTELKKCGKINSNTRVWNLVHDEIEVHCHKDEVDIVLPLVKRLMEEAGKEICPDVLHIAEADYGYRWDK